jgi:hypothetical protein
MCSEHFEKSFAYVEILMSQEQLRAFKTASFPHSKARDRGETFKEVRKMAIPYELDTREVISTDKAGEQIRKLLGGK